MQQKNKVQIIEELNKNNLVILPTDTVYGVMAKFYKENEIKINKFKNSDINKKLSVILYNKKQLFKYIDKLNFFRKLLICFLLPGKYTFIVNLKKEICEKHGFDRTDFGVRITKNKELQDIIKESGPLLATSCNKTGEPVCLNLKDIEKSFKEENISIYYTEELKNKPSVIYNLITKKITKIR